MPVQIRDLNTLDEGEHCCKLRFPGGTNSTGRRSGSGKVAIRPHTICLSERHWLRVVRRRTLPRLNLCTQYCRKIAMAYDLYMMRNFCYTR